MNNKKTIARVGNFIVTKENGNGMDWVSIKAVSGFWTMRFRQDNMMSVSYTHLTLPTT